MRKKLITIDEITNIARKNGFYIEMDVYIKLKKNNKSFLLVAADISNKPPFNELYFKAAVNQAVNYLSN